MPTDTKALRALIQKVRDIHADIEEFDGDRRGMYAALADAEKALRRALLDPDVLDALASLLDAEPVAWRYRYADYNTGEPLKWRYGRGEAYASQPGYEVQPLYTTPSEGTKT